MALDFDGFLQSESARFLEVLRDTDPGARVPCCPDWSAADLAYHLSEVQTQWAEVVRDRRQSRSKTQPARPDSYDDLLAPFPQITAALSDALAGAADDDHVWTWFDDDQTVGFVRRRQAHEALIHRLDAEETAGVPPTDVDPQLAADGVAECLEVMFAYVPPWATFTAGGPVGAVVTTDTATRWAVQAGSWSGTSPRTGREFTDRPVVRIVPEGEEAEDTITTANGEDAGWEVKGPARDLDAWLWGRPTLTQIERRGDTTAFESVVRQGVQ